MCLVPHEQWDIGLQLCSTMEGKAVKGQDKGISLCCTSNADMVFMWLSKSNEQKEHFILCWSEATYYFFIIVIVEVCMQDQVTEF